MSTSTVADAALVTRVVIATLLPRVTLAGETVAVIVNGAGFACTLALAVGATVFVGAGVLVAGVLGEPAGAPPDCRRKTPASQFTEYTVPSTASFAMSTGPLQTPLKHVCCPLYAVHVVPLSLTVYHGPRAWALSPPN